MPFIARRHNDNEEPNTFLLWNYKQHPVSEYVRDTSVVLNHWKAHLSCEFPEHRMYLVSRSYDLLGTLRSRDVPNMLSSYPLNSYWIVLVVGL